MKIYDLDHIKDIETTSNSITGGISFTVNGNTGVLFIALNDQEATGGIAINKADVGINFDEFNFDDIKF